MSAGVRRSPSPRERQGVTQFLGTIPAESDSTGDVGRTIFEGLTSCLKAAYLNDLRNGISTVHILDRTENLQGQNFPLRIILGAVGQRIAQGQGLEIDDLLQCGGKHFSL